jgi:esterase/lipase superfamily enzyme
MNVRRWILVCCLVLLAGIAAGAAYFLLQPKITKYHPRFGADCEALLTPATQDAVDCVRVLFGTNREIQLDGNEPGLNQEADVRQLLSGDAGRLHLGRADVWLPKLIEEGGSRDRGETPMLEGPPPEEGSELAKYVFLTRITKAGTDAFMAELDEAVTGRGGSSVLLFVHGFNTPFDDALIRSAQLSVDLSQRGVFDAGAPVLFSWPSAGKVSLEDYRGDQDRSLAAAPYLEEFLDLITGKAEIKRINIVAHSMGNRILTEALKSYARDYLERHGRDDLEFRIILVAADVDRDIFEATTGVLDNLQANVTIYTSDADRALHVSELVNSKLRLGDTNGDKPFIRTDPYYETVDATGIATELFGLGHNYYSDNPFILGDIHCAMAEANPELRALERRRYGNIPDGSEYFRLNAKIDPGDEECSLFRDAFPLTNVSEAVEPVVEPSASPVSRRRTAPQQPDVQEEPEAPEAPEVQEVEAGPAEPSAAAAEADAARERILEEAERQTRQKSEPPPPPRPPVPEPPPIVSPPPPAPPVAEPAPELPGAVEIVLQIPDRKAFDAAILGERLRPALTGPRPVLIEISAYTSSEGEQSDNLALSQRWADELRDRLINQGIEADTVSAFGFGEDWPAAVDADSPENQRIIVYISYY